MNSTDRPVWLVTGAAGTLGSELVRQIIAGGSDCIALDRDEAGLNRLHDELAKSGLKPPALVPLDLIGAAPADYDKLAETMESEFGRLDRLVHNAAMLVALRPLVHQPADEWMKVLQTGLTGPYLLTSALLPLLRETGGSQVIFVSDDHCLEKPANWAAYGVAQAGRKWMASALSAELGSASTKVQTIDPGPFYSRLRSAAWPVARPDEFDPIARVAARVIADIEGGAK